MVKREQETNANQEPRRGIAPFANGIAKVIEEEESERLTSEWVPFGSLGEASVFLESPSFEEARSTSNRAFTIDLFGKIKRGSYRDFAQKDYYNVGVVIKPYDVVIDEAQQKLKINMWINNTKPTVSYDLIDILNIGFYIIYFSEKIDPDKNTLEYFVLPENQEILQAVRINVSNIQENSIEPNSRDL